MDESKKSDIMDKMTKVCICKGISRASIKKAIKEGAATVDEVNKITGSGGGSCGGRRCREKILMLINEQEEKL
nr:(2Fe-2S)-binding protein [Sedimentibacter sp.]